MRLSTELKSQQAVKLEVTWHMGQKGLISRLAVNVMGEIPDFELLQVITLQV